MANHINHTACSRSAVFTWLDSTVGISLIIYVCLFILIVKQNGHDDSFLEH